MSNKSSKRIIDINLFLQNFDRKNKTIVFTNGCFDLLHEGHFHLLKQAKKLGDVLIVAVNTDDSIKRLKGNARPIETLETRLSKLSEVVEVDYLITFSEDTPLKLIQQVQPDILVKGGDYSPENIIGKEFVKQVIVVPLLDGFSTTRIIESKE